MRFAGAGYARIRPRCLAFGTPGQHLRTAGPPVATTDGRNVCRCRIATACGIAIRTGRGSGLWTGAGQGLLASLAASGRAVMLHGDADQAPDVMEGATRMLHLGLMLWLLASPTVAAAPQTIRFQLRDNLISVSAAINGEHVNAVLDTGTGTIAVSTSLAARLGLKLGQSARQAEGGGTGDQSLFPVTLRRVQLGPVDLHDVQGFAINLDSISSSAGLKIDALMGYPIFSDHVVRIDYGKQRISIQPGTAALACQNPVPFRIIDDGPVVVAQVRIRPGGKTHTVHLVVDLGSRHYNYLGSNFLRTGPGKTLYAGGPQQVVGNGAGGRVKGVVTKVAELDIGAQRFHDVTFALTTQVKAFNLKEIDGSLGVPLWKGGVITFDYPRKQLCIQTPRG